MEASKNSHWFLRVLLWDSQTDSKNTSDRHMQLQNKTKQTNHLSRYREIPFKSITFLAVYIYSNCHLMTNCMFCVCKILETLKIKFSYNTIFCFSFSLNSAALQSLRLRSGLCRPIKHHTENSISLDLPLCMVALTCMEEHYCLDYQWTKAWEGNIHF